MHTRWIETEFDNDIEPLQATAEAAAGRAGDGSRSRSAGKRLEVTLPGGVRPRPAALAPRARLPRPRAGRAACGVAAATGRRADSPDAGHDRQTRGRGRRPRRRPATGRGARGDEDGATADRPQGRHGHRPDCRGRRRPSPLARDLRDQGRDRREQVAGDQLGPRGAVRARDPASARYRDWSGTTDRRRGGIGSMPRHRWPCCRSRPPWPLFPGALWIHIAVPGLFLLCSVGIVAMYADDIRVSRLHRHGIEPPADPDLGRPSPLPSRPLGRGGAQLGGVGWAGRAARTVRQIKENRRVNSMSLRAASAMLPDSDG